MAHSLFITGSTGFIGRRLLARLQSDHVDRVYCLTRDTRVSSTPAGSDICWVVGSLFDGETYGKYLERCEMVIHLAAITGKAPPEQYFAVNSLGTRFLLEECRARGVKRFLHVSSIVVNYTDVSDYDYARSKQEAEAAVRSSGLSYTIVRPTIVLGKGSPAWKMLSKLAGLAIVPIVGDGTARIQPVHVDDLSDALTSIIDDTGYGNESLDFGGPDILSIEDLLRRIRRLYGRGEPAIVHFPLAAVKAVVAYAERYVPSLMPVNRGQLSVFLQDGTITPNRLHTTRRPHMKDLDSILNSLKADGTPTR